MDDFYPVLSKLSDVLGIPLTLESGEVFGSGSFTMEFSPEVKVALSITVVKSMLTDTVSLLAHVHGDLHILVGYNPSRDGLSLFLLNCTKTWVLADHRFRDSAPLAEVVTTLGHCIVASYAYSKQSGGWSKFNLK